MAKGSKNKLLAEWFWTDRWMGSSGFLLPMEAKGLYREMLTQAWRREASLPNDHEAIRRATGCTAGEWRRSWPKIERYWKAEGGVLFNETQRAVYAEAKAALDRASDRGRKGGQATAQARTQAPPKRPLERVPERSLAGQPPSPSLSPTTNEEESRKARAGKDAPPNPHVNRQALIDEGNRLIPRISSAADMDPTEVLSKASAWRGHSYVRLDVIPDDRLAHTLNALRTWDRTISGEAEPTAPKAPEPPSARAQQRADGIRALVTGKTGGDVE